MKIAFEALNKRGELVKSVVTASSEEDAVTKLQARGLLPTHLMPVQQTALQKPYLQNSYLQKQGAPSRGLGSLEINLAWLKPRARLKDIIQLIRRLATLHEAGISLTRSLYILEKQFSSSAALPIVQTLLAEVDAGGSLSSGLSKQPKYFNGFHVAIVNSGEMSGELEDALDRLAKNLEETAARRRKLITAMVYPCIIAVVCILLISGISIWIVPIFQQVYEDSDIEMPPLTLQVLSVNDWLLTNWYWILASFGIGLGMLRYAMRKSPPIEYAVHIFLLKIPILGQIIYKSNFSWFFRFLATMLNSGVGIIEALKVVANVNQNAVIRETIVKVSQGVYEGRGFMAELDTMRGMDIYAISMIDVGEQAGRLPDMLNRVAASYEEDLNILFERMETLFTPIVILILGNIVGFVLVALMMPYLNYITHLSSSGF